MLAWPFHDPPDAPAFTTVRVMEGLDEITFVSHDADDGAWQFHHPRAGQFPRMAEAVVVALGEIVKLDESVVELADLPPGWCAERRERGSAWSRAPQGSEPT